MKNIQSQIGVTLMELVVTLAILGVLAAVGTPVLLGNIRAAKNAEAQNTLKAIYLMQKNYFVENYCYYVNSGAGDNTSLINQNLLGSSTPNSGPITVGGNNDFYFYIVPGAVGSSGSCTGTNANDYIAYAQSRSDTNLVYSLNQQNVKTGF
ncbi:type II secretion system protein [Polynucleobacter sp. 80A-SIGWE]|uniref:type II secretion system protein n=1 Tax=Polynucleobacter sp. 80A-SIGWE TaxID=2689100 RepID=UPI001C0B346F|nr:type II secretion system protein [Polynucleobacter sp. 80A-SIGWE]MBU3589313.1 type II secretion system protein [Polynucleobacter sp. 80A-SIGWE]